MEKKISLKDALCGVEFAFEHLDGRQIVVKTKPGEVVKPSAIKVLANEGMPLYKSPFQRGRLFIYFKVVFPDQLDQDTIRKVRDALPATDLDGGQVPMGDEVEERDDMLDMDIEEFGKVAYSSTTGGESYDSDDEDGGGMPRGVQCAQS